MRIPSAFRNGAEPDGPSDERLVARVASGDQEAFARLYDRYVRRVYVVAAHVLGPGRAEEVVQDAFISLWRSAHRYDPARGAFATWFMAVARHRILGELRRRTVEQGVFAAEPVDEKAFLRTTREQGPFARSYGKLYTRRDLRDVVAFAARLPEAPEDRAYHLWLTVDGRTELGGVLAVRDGFGLVVLKARRPGPHYQAAAPACGSGSGAVAAEVRTAAGPDAQRPFAFQPAEVRVAAGSTVRWTNADGVFHTVTSTASPERRSRAASSIARSPRAGRRSSSSSSGPAPTTSTASRIRSSSPGG